MPRDGPGATLLMRFPKERFNRQLVEDIFGHLFNIEYKDVGQNKAWHREDWRKNYVDLVYNERKRFMVLTYWDQRPPEGGPIGRRTVAQYCIDLNNQLALHEPGFEWFIIWVQNGNFDVIEFDKVARVVANFKKIVEEIKPSFAAIDNYDENMAKRKGKDPRRFAWGVTYYDAEHVEKIGLENLRGCAALIKEEWPDDSMWIQTWDNPLIVAKELTQQMEKELGLKKIFTKLGA